jgi:hypothetical protein
VVVRDTTILNNPTGILIQPSGGIAAKAVLGRLRIDGNSGEGLRVDGAAKLPARSMSPSPTARQASTPVPAHRTVRQYVGSPYHNIVEVAETSGSTASMTLGGAVLYANAIGTQATGWTGCRPNRWRPRQCA